MKKQWVKWIRINLFRRRSLPSPDKVILYQDTVERINNSGDSYKPSNLVYESVPADEKQLDKRYKIEPRANLLD